MALMVLESADELIALEPNALVARLQAFVADTAFSQDLKRAYAPNSLRTAGADWRIWCEFCRRTQRTALPATSDSLRQFLTERISAGRARATLDHYLWTLGLVHRLGDLPWPLSTEGGRLMWRGLRRQLPKRQNQKHGLVLDEVDQVIGAMGDSPVDVRDAAMLSIASETLARPSDLVALAVEHVTFNRNGTGRVLFVRSKTDQEAEGAIAAISVETARRTRRWIEHADLTKGALFRSIPVVAKPRTREPLPGLYAWPLSTRDVQRIYKRRAAVVGLDWKNISGHSPRVGSAQDLMAAGFSGPQIQQQGRWKSERMVLRYSEHLRADRGAMAQLLARRRERKPPG